MRRILLLTSIFILCFSLYGDFLIRISPDDFKLASQSLKGLDIAGASRDKFYDIVTDEAGAEILTKAGIKFTKLDSKTDITGYIDLSEMYSEVESLHARYPDLTDIDTLVFTAQYNFPVVALKIHGTSPDTYAGGKSFLLMGNHHAREWQTVTLPLFYADSILSAYDSDADIKKLIDSVFIVIVPSVNPDGYYYSHDLANNFWRKNRSYRSGNYGVDLNRNYPGGTNAITESDWGYVGQDAATHYLSNELYCGPYQASEREVRAIMALFNIYDFTLSISLHSYGEEIMWPWGSISNNGIDSILLQETAEKIASRMRKQDGITIYDAYSSYNLYPSTGDSDDWIYGWTKYMKGKTTIPFTIEVDVNFQPSASTQDSLFRRIFPGLLYASFLSDSLYDAAEEVPLKPSAGWNGGDTIFWSSQNQALADYYTVYNLSSPSYVSDSINDSTLYVNTGYELSTSLPYSGLYSFRSVPANNSARILRPLYSLSPSSSDSLVLFVKYDLEQNYDKAFIEASYEGYEWFPVDTFSSSFTGTNTTWQRKAYSLSPFSGKEIYVRVRTVFDSYTLNSGGMFADNISRLLKFADDSVFSSSLTDTFILIDLDGSGNEYFSIVPHCASGYTQYSDRILCMTSNIQNAYADSVYAKSARISYSPGERALHIYFSSGEIKTITVELFDISGRKVFSKSGAFRKNAAFKLSSLVPGRYFVSVKGMETDKSGILIIN